MEEIIKEIENILTKQEEIKNKLCKERSFSFLRKEDNTMKVLLVNGSPHEKAAHIQPYQK